MIYHTHISTKYSIRYQQYSLPFLEKKKLTLTNPKNGNLTHYPQIDADAANPCSSPSSPSCHDTLTIPHPRETEVNTWE